MTPDDAHETLANGHDAGVTSAIVDRAAAARRQAGTREAKIRRCVINEAVPGIGQYLAQVRPTIQPDIDNGWRIGMVDLASVIALQPVTFTDHYAEQTYELTSNDIEQIAKITLPLPDDRPPLIQADPNGHAWIVSSSNPHLQVLEAVNDSATSVFGFRLGRPTSVLKIADVDGRALCLDGHHRVHQLLKRGIASAPGIYRAFSSVSQLPQLPPGLFGEEIVCGTNPPFIADLLNDRVAADVLAPATRKYLLVEARELVLPV
jgi:hypothetical protein